MAAIAPSSKALARAVADLVKDVKGPVLEIGAGNGALTAALIQPGRLLVAIERDRGLAAVVAKQYPSVRVAVCDARSAPCVLRDMKIDPVDAVVSGLGLKAMNAEELDRITWAASQCLKPGGRWIQFSYSPSSPVPIHLQEKYGLIETRVGRVLNNLPPAYLFSYSKA